jgi:hypothetical protein
MGDTRESVNTLLAGPPRDSLPVGPCQLADLTQVACWREMQRDGSGKIKIRLSGSKTGVYIPTDVTTLPGHASLRTIEAMVRWRDIPTISDDI